MTEYERGFEAGVVVGMKRATFKLRMQKSAQRRRYYQRNREKEIEKSKLYKRKRRAQLRGAEVAA